MSINYAVAINQVYNLNTEYSDGTQYIASVCESMLPLVANKLLMVLNYIHKTTVFH